MNVQGLVCCIPKSIRMSVGGREEGNDTLLSSPESVSFTHQLLCTHITALSVKGSLAFIGEGQHCHVHDVVSGRHMASTQVFRAGVVHGLKIQPSPGNSSTALLVLAFGQKSLALLLYLTVQGKFFVLLDERSVEDWIVDAGLEKDLSHIVIATGHNSLLRCETPHLEERCRQLYECISGSSSKPLANIHHSVSEASAGQQGPASVGLVNRVREQSDGKANKPSPRTAHHSIPETLPVTESIDLVNRIMEARSSGLTAKKHGSTGVLTEMKIGNDGGLTVNKDDRIDGLTVKEGGKKEGLTVKESERNGGLTVAARVACVERCVLFSGHLVMLSGCWEGAVMLAGTMALQVMVWGPWGPRNSEGSALPLHCLWGHQGSIFSITYHPSQDLITTTSDDRSLRVWQVVRPHTHPFPTTPEQEQLYWTKARITEKSALYGHRARVWQSLILPSYLVSVGEDSMVCIWEHSGALAASWRAHEGASIWSVAASEGPKARLITGGADGSVKAWSLSAVAPVRAEPVDGLPLGGSSGHGKCLGPAGRCPEVTAEQGDLNLPLNNKEKKFKVTKFSEPFLDTHEAVNLKNIPIEAADLPWKTAEQNDELFSISEGECNMAVSHELFQDMPSVPRALKHKPLSRSATTDFPRCLALTGDGIVLVVTNSGKVYSSSHGESWYLEHEDERLKNYAILEASPDRRRVAVGTLSGVIVVFHLTKERRLVKEGEAEGPPGKVFALQWLMNGYILALGAAGVMTTWEIHSEGTVQAVSTHHLPISMHRWLCAVYVFSANTPTACTPADTTTPPSPQHLVCGDRAGSLHLYTLTHPKPQDTLRAIHGKNGVTSLLSWGGSSGIVYSSGRDGCVRSLQVCCGEGVEDCHHLQPLTVTRVCGSSWVARLLCVWGRLLAVCFHGVKLRLWDMEAEHTLLEVECGGAHRSWDLLVCSGEQDRMVCGSEESSHVRNAEDSLMCGFLKDGLPYIFSASLTDRLLPIIKPPLNSQETMGVCVLHQQGTETLLVTAGEDTTLRLHSLSQPEHCQPLAVLRSHLSGVRALCLVEGLISTLNYNAKDEKSNVLMRQITDNKGNGSNVTGTNIVKNKEWRGHAKEGIGGNDFMEGNGGGKWIGQGTNSAGKNTDVRKHEKWRGPAIDGNEDDAMDKNKSKWREQVTSNTGKDIDTIWMVSAGGRAEFKVWQCVVNKSANISSPKRASFPCDTSNPPGMTCEGNQEVNVTCREVASHMLRTGSHKIWRNQQLTFDTETRYMAAAAHWVTSSLALVALASSDGFLRLFSFHYGGERFKEVKRVEGVPMKEVCAVDYGCCLLGVTRLVALTRFMLVTSSTRGHVTFWDLQGVMESLIQHKASQEDSSPSENPQPQQITTVAAHQSGVNSIAFHHYPDNPRHITMATGGDDNKISVWEVLVGISEGVEVLVTHLCSVFGHASQVSGLAWLSGEHLLSASIDQRLIVWKYNQGEAPERDPEEGRIILIKPREFNSAPRKENISTQEELENARTTHTEERELKKKEDSTICKQLFENKETLIKPEPYRARPEVRAAYKTLEPCQTTADESTACHQVLMPLGSYFTGVPDIKGFVVTDVDQRRERGKNNLIEKRVFVYGMGLQVFDVAVTGSVR